MLIITTNFSIHIDSFVVGREIIFQSFDLLESELTMFMAC